LRPSSTANIDAGVASLGQGVKDLISTMNELEKLGLGNLKIPLAKCVVCGRLLLVDPICHKILI